MGINIGSRFERQLFNIYGNFVIGFRVKRLDYKYVGFQGSNHSILSALAPGGLIDLTRQIPIYARVRSSD